MIDWLRGVIENILSSFFLSFEAAYKCLKRLKPWLTGWPSNARRRDTTHSGSSGLVSTDYFVWTHSCKLNEFIWTHLLPLIRWFMIFPINIQLKRQLAPGFDECRNCLTAFPFQCTCGSYKKSFFFLWNKMESLGCIWHENACDDVINTSSYPIPAYLMYSQVPGAREIVRNKAERSQS